MHLNKLHIKNFRCFRDYEIEFAPRVTVLFGKNGAGKSTLIHAIHKALSFAFDPDSKNMYKINLRSGFPKLKVEQYIETDGIRDEKTGMMFPYIDIEAEGNFQNVSLIWNLYASTSTFNLQPSKYLEAYKSLINRIVETNKMPFMAYYSDSFPHISKPIKTSSKQDKLKNLGYLDWNEESACSEIWLSRLKRTWTQWDRADRSVKDAESALNNCEILLQQGIVKQHAYEEDVKLHNEKLRKSLNERSKYEDELSAIKACLINFSKGDNFYEITDVFLSVYEESDLCLETKQGDNPSFRLLPAGYKRLYFMVLDIAYRSYILNGTTDAEGIVIIDEIDLHLHPGLEQVVLGRFMNTFPNLQFIVSTHSPLVLTGLETKGKDNTIIQMTSELGTEKLREYKAIAYPNIYGLDYNLMLEENMGVQKREPLIQKLFDKAWQYVSEKEINKAKEVVDRLEELTPSDQSELIRLRSIINRLELLGR